MTGSNAQMASAIKGRMFMYGGICTAIFGVLSIMAAFSSEIHWGFFGYVALFISGSVLTTIGVIVGDVLRRMAMPDMYFTKGFADSIQKRIFWAVGPQAIGWFIGLIATNGFMQNYLGYDMQSGQGRVTQTAPRAQTAPDPKPSWAMNQKSEASAPQPTASSAPNTATAIQQFQLIEVGACVMGKHRQTANGMEFVKPIPVFSQGGSVESTGMMQTFSAFYAEEQHSVTGRVRLMYAPGAFEDEPKAGTVLGWVNAADLEVYEMRNCQ